VSNLTSANGEAGGVTSGARATLDAWRERGADRLDPIRFHFMEALDRRAAGHSGALATLIDHIAGHHAPADGIDPAAGNAVPQRTSYPELEALEYFRETWSKVRSEKQLRQSLKKAPGNAGPLNSSSLVHRSLSLMRELSPGYLQQFLSYVDALSWMEQMNGGSALPAKDAPRAATTRKSARSKPR
jgi:hypothetical protein